LRLFPVCLPDLLFAVCYLLFREAGYR
jgi:hypothetical protein